MDILKDLFTAIRGGVRKKGEALVDANAICITEQKIKDAEDDLKKAEYDLSEIMVKDMQAKRKVSDLKSQISEYEKNIVELLAKGNEPLALDVSNKMAGLESQLAIETKAQETFSAHCNRLEGTIRKTQNGLTSMKQQLVMVKSTESVQKAVQSVNSKYTKSGSNMLSAKESLDRIQKRQIDTEDRFAAEQELENKLNGNDLDAKLKAAGIGNSDNTGEDILARIKAKQG